MVSDSLNDSLGSKLGGLKYQSNRSTIILSEYLASSNSLDLKIRHYVTNEEVSLFVVAPSIISSEQPQMSIITIKFISESNINPATDIEVASNSSIIGLPLSIEKLSFNTSEQTATIRIGNFNRSHLRPWIFINLPRTDDWVEVIK